MQSVTKSGPHPAVPIGESALPGKGKQKKVQPRTRGRKKKPGASLASSGEHVGRKVRGER